MPWTPGQHLAWGVTWRGLRVGTLRLGVSAGPGPLLIESRFQTIGLAHQLNPIDHRLTTTRSSPKLNDLHSALARIRGWASPKATPAHLVVQHHKQTFQVKLAEPVLDNSLAHEAIRVDGQARSAKMNIDLSLWLSVDKSHTPLQITLATNGNKVHATLLADDASR